jgi:excisionase family DNA binding protein
MNKGDLISIREAAKILGVSEPALRTWTDGGNIKAFVTPGGHRRYSRNDLKQFADSNPKPMRMKDLMVVLEETAPAHREIGLSYIRSAHLSAKEGIELQQNLGKLGHQLLSLIIKYLTLPAERKQTLDSIRDAGSKFGEMTAALDFPLIDSVQAFIRHRDPVVTAATGFIRKGEHLNSRIAQAIPLVDRAMDEALVCLVKAHQNYPGRSLKEAKGETAK